MLARELAGVLDARLELVCAYAYSTPYAVVAYGALGRKDFEVDIERPAHDALRARREAIGEDVEATVVRASSPPHGLDQVAREREAEMIVVGSTHRGALGRITPGSVAERVLAGAPCAVAVPPAGFAAGAPHVSVSWASPSTARLRAARRWRLPHESRTVPAQPCVSLPRSSFSSRARRRRESPSPAARRCAPCERRANIDAALIDLDFPGPIERRVELGSPVAILVEESSRSDLLACGSRGYGLVRQVLLGGVSSRLVRAAACPVVVTPRSALHA